MTESIASFVSAGLLTIASLAFAESSISDDGVCSNAEVGDFIWNIAIGDIDVVFGGSGWTDSVDLDVSDGNYIYVHDIDGDGNEDFVITGTTPPWVDRVGPRKGAIYFNDGDGTFTLAGGDRPMSEHARVLLFEDFDGDERTDIFVLDHGWDTHPFPGFPNQLLLNKESGFVDASATHLPDNNADFSHGGAAGDIDNDGDLDIFISNVNLEAPYILINDGTGHFTKNTSRLPAEFFADELLPPLSANMTDFDQDGYVDLFIGTWFDRPNAIYWGNAEGVYSSDSLTPLPFPFFDEGEVSYPTIAVADFNDDGVQDVLLESDYYQESGIQILINRGDRSFADETLERIGENAFTGPDTWSVGFRFFDFNGDGTIDIVPSKYDPNSAEVLVWLNDGTGHYAALTHGMYGNPQASSRFSTSYILNTEGFSAIEFFYHEGNLAMNAGVVTVDPVLTHSGTGSEGRDFVTGSNCDDTINAGPGEDRLDGGQGDDVLEGGAGNDELNDPQGNETYILNQEDLAWQDLIWDYGGEDSLKFADFDLDRVASAEQTENGHLQINFTDGGGIVVIAHFNNPEQAVERLVVGDCSYRISRDSGFVSGPFHEILSGCVLFENGFE